MTQRDQDYQTLATAINTLLYSLGYKQYFNTSDMDDGIVLSCNKKTLESIFAEIDSILPDPNRVELKPKKDEAGPVAQVNRNVPTGHYQRLQNDLCDSPDITLSYKDPKDEHTRIPKPIRIQLTLGSNYGRRELNTLIQAINKKSSGHLIDTYIKPVSETFQQAHYIISGLVNPRYAEGVLVKMQEELQAQSEKLDKLKAELAARQNINGIGWGTRMLAEPRTGTYRA